MSPTLALVLWLVLLLALLRYDPAADRRLSVALWIPVAWFSMIGSRLPAQWLSGGIGFSAAGFSEGNSFDRAVYLSLIGLSLATLTLRSFRWQSFFRANVWLVLLLLYGLASIAWSDYSFVAFKRWFRDLGVYFAILVILSSDVPMDAVRWVFRRVFYLLIPASVLLVKYFPHMAREYDQWSGQGYFVGVATSKNMLGVLCMVSTLFFAWDSVVRWSERHQPTQRATLIVNACFLTMSTWLLSIAHSATSTVCLVLGLLILLVACTPPLRSRPIVLAILIPCGLAAYGFLEFVLGVDLISVVSRAVGRSPDLTGRAEIWSVVLSAGANPIIGTGYESFWLGSRLAWVWAHTVNVNTAHNGYLEVYLSLGAIGLCLLVGFLASGYVTIARRFIHDPLVGSLGMAVSSILLFYNVTESAFRVSVLWVMFLTMAIILTGPIARPAQLRGQAVDDGRPQPQSFNALRPAKSRRSQLPRPRGRQLHR